jgi:hypothetical protein
MRTVLQKVLQLARYLLQRRMLMQFSRAGIQYGSLRGRSATMEGFRIVPLSMSMVENFVRRLVKNCMEDEVSVDLEDWMTPRAKVNIRHHWSLSNIVFRLCADLRVEKSSQICSLWKSLGCVVREAYPIIMCLGSCSRSFSVIIRTVRVDSSCKNVAGAPIFPLS